MTSVRKLVLVPKEEWDKILKLVPNQGTDDHKVVSVPMGPGARQVGSGVEKVVVEEDKVVPPAAPPPTPPPPGGEEGKGEGGGGEDKYVDRQETGKDQSRQEIRRDAGIWRPPGLPVRSRRPARPWIYV